MTIDRVDVLRASTQLTGIDFIQVSPSQTELFVFLQHDVLPNVPPLKVADTLAALSTSDIHVTGEGQVDPPRVKVIPNVTPLSTVDGRTAMRLIVEMPGGFGYYRLKLDTPAIDPYFNN